MDRLIDCEIFRRFGVEIELNTSDGNIKKIEKFKKQIPLGSDIVASIIKKSVDNHVKIQSWGYNNNNTDWIVKPDSSCGIEVCTPVLKGWLGLEKLLRVVDSFNQNNLKADDRCSVHVHIDVSDLSYLSIASIMSWFIKCEHVFMDSFPSSRKLNRYCQMIGTTDMFHDDYKINPMDLIERVSGVKYYTINAYHLMKGGGINDSNNRKRTIEFRLGDNSMCLNSFNLKNWIKLILHFVDITKDLPFPEPYKENDSHTGLLWLDPKDVFQILKFYDPCTDGFDQMKYWFKNRILNNGFNNNLYGIWSNEARSHAREDFLKCIEKFNLRFDDHVNLQNAVYDKKYII